jgi:two-component system cell cycle response regulator
MARVAIVLIGVRHISHTHIWRAFPLDTEVAVSPTFDGERGLRMVRETRPDIVIVGSLTSDVGRELSRSGRRVLDGAEICQRLKADSATRHIPIVMVTELRGVEWRAKAVKAGVDAFLFTPIRHEELEETLRQLVST